MKSIHNIPLALWPKLKCDTIGRPIIYSTNIIVPLITDKDKYGIEDKTRLNYQYMVGMSITIPETTAQKITQTLTTASRAVIAATKLSLRDETDFVLENFPLLKILEANSNGFIWDGYNGMVNIAESELVNVNAAAIGSATAIELHVHYCKFNNGGAKTSAI